MEEKLEVVDEEINEKRNYVVYKHTSPSGKVYIGITGKAKPRDRWGRDGNGYKHNKYFYKAIQKYGWDNIRHEILFSELTREEAIQKEIELISLFKSQNHRYGYNISAGGDGTVGVSHYGETNPFYNRHHSQDSKDKISEATSVAVCQYSKNGELLNTYNSLTEASLATGLSIGSLGNYCRKLKHCKILGGYIWRYKGEDLTEEDIKNCNINGNSKTVYQYLLNGEFVKMWNSLAQIENELGYNHSAISRVCLGKQEKAYGYIWRYADGEDN